MLCLFYICSTTDFVQGSSKPYYYKLFNQNLIVVQIVHIYTCVYFYFKIYILIIM